MTDLQIFAKILKTTRKSKKMSQDELSKILNIDQAVLSRIENNKQRAPFGMLFDVLKVFNMSLVRYGKMRKGIMNEN